MKLFYTAITHARTLHLFCGPGFDLHHDTSIEMQVKIYKTHMRACLIKGFSEKSSFSSCGVDLFAIIFYSIKQKRTEVIAMNRNCVCFSGGLFYQK